MAAMWTTEAVTTVRQCIRKDKQGQDLEPLPHWSSYWAAVTTGRLLDSRGTSLWALSWPGYFILSLSPPNKKQKNKVSAVIQIYRTASPSVRPKQSWRRFVPADLSPGSLGGLVTPEWWAAGVLSLPWIHPVADYWEDQMIYVYLSLLLHSYLYKQLWSLSIFFGKRNPWFPQLSCVAHC